MLLVKEPAGAEVRGWAGKCSEDGMDSACVGRARGPSVRTGNFDLMDFSVGE